MVINEEFLQFCSENGNLTFEEACHEYERMNNQKYLDMHTGKIWHGKDGDWYTKVKAPDGKLKIRHAVSREKLEKIILEYYKDNELHPTVASVFNEWMNERTQYEEVKPATLDRIKTDFSRFFGVNDFKDRRIDSVKEENLTPFIKTCIHDYSLTAKAWNNLKGVIIGIFTYAKEHKYTTFSISTYLGDLRLPKGIFRKTIIRDEDQIFTDNEIMSIVGWITEAGERLNSLTNLGIMLDFMTGLRAGELCTLKFSDFDGNQLSVARTETRSKNPDGPGYVYRVDEATKGKAGFRKITVPDAALSIVEKIRELNPDGEYLFMYGEHRLIADAFSKKLRRICGYIGISERSMHKIRKTYATILIDSGSLTEKTIINQMGHADSEVTRQHYYYDRARKEDILQQVNQIFPDLVTSVTR